MKRNQPVHEIMSPDPVTVHQQQKVSEVHKLLSERNIHHVPVIDGKRLIGLISSNDLLRVSWGDTDKQDPRQFDALLDTLTIRQVMREDIVTITRGDTVRKAAELLAQGGYHCLPVLDGEDLVGVLTTTDIIKYLLEQY